MPQKIYRSGLGLGDTSDSLMTGQGSRFLSKIFGQSEDYQWQRGEVLEIDLNPAQTEFIGRIKFRLTSQAGKDEQSSYYALPLITYIRSYPVLHEIVAVTELDGQFYWLSALNTLGLVNNNVQANLTAVNSSKDNSDNNINNYKESQANGIPKSSNESETSYGETFKNNRFKVSPLLASEGDFILEGRFGQSIRLGNNSETNTPNMKFSVRLPIESFKVDSENLDEDSCIFITTDEILTFNPIGIPIADVNNPPHEYNGKQIMITSDRLIFGAKLNEILMFSNKTISLASNDNFSVDTDKKIVTNSTDNTEINTQKKIITKSKENTEINSQKQFLLQSENEAKLKALKVMIGNFDANEPLVLGNKWVKIMEEILDILIKHTHPTGTGPSGPPIEAAQLGTKKSSISQKNQLSDDNFTTKKNK